MILLDLFIGFLKVGLFSFGGAYAAIPLIREVVLSYGWLSEDTFSYMIAVSESTPGPIMVNLATYVGSSQAGLLGAAIATFAVVLPAFFIIVLVMIMVRALLQHPYVRAVLDGLTPCVVGIVLAIGCAMVAGNCFGAEEGLDFRAVGITAVLITILLWYKHRKKKKLSPITLILIAGVLGIIIYGI